MYEKQKCKSVFFRKKIYNYCIRRYITQIDIDLINNIVFLQV